MSKEGATGAAANGPPKSSIDTSQILNGGDEMESPVEFTGDVNTNDEIPNQEVLKKVGNFMLLDRDGRAVQFKDLYSGPNVARRVLVIFIRHFFCGVCFLPQPLHKTLEANQDRNSTAKNTSALSPNRSPPIPSSTSLSRPSLPWSAAARPP